MTTNQQPTNVEASDSENVFAPSRLSVTDFGAVKLWEVLWRRWLIILVGVLVGWILAVAYFLAWPKTYESSAKILVMRKDPTVAASGVSRGLEVEGPQVTSELLATHMVLLTSLKIVSEALHRDGLDQLPSILVRLKIAQGQTPADYVIENLNVTSGGEGPAQDAHVLNVPFRHASAEDAQRVVEAVVRRYQEFLDEKFVDVNSESAKLIAQARGDLAGELKAVEEEYRRFRAEAPLLWTSQEGLMNGHRIQYEQIQKQLADLEPQTSEVASRLKLTEAAYEELKQGATGLDWLALIDAKNAERVSLLVSVQQGEARSAQFQSLQPERAAAAQAEYENLPDLLARERTLLQDFGPAHPEVVDTRNSIAVIGEFVGSKSKSLDAGPEELVDPERLVNAYVSLLQHDVASLRQREKDLQAFADREEEAAKSVVKYELQDEEIRSRLERAQQLYTVVLDRLRDINLAKDYSGLIHEVIAAPRLGRVVWPQLIICLVLGSFVGLVLGSSGAVVAEIRDDSFHNPEEIEQALGLPVLTHVPSLDGSPHRTSATALDTNSSQVDPLVWAFHHPRSPEAELFRGLRTSLYSRVQRQSLKVMAVTSPSQGDGKSTVAVNLAVSIGQSGRRVLLVDCNLRCPRMHEIFGLENDVGLTTVLAGHVDPPDAIKATAANNLWVLPSGRLPPDPSELLASSAFRQFLELARDRYDVVLLDCPPVLAVSDPCIVAPLADAVALVVRGTKHARSQTLQAKNMLIGVGADLVGAVVNAGHSPRRGYGFRSRYTYRVGYDYDYENGMSDSYYESDAQHKTEA